MLKVQAEVLAEIIAHAQRDAPVEACGYLAERDDVVCKSYPLRNADASPQHFSFSPAEQFAAVKAMRADGLKLRGVYHSHPAGPAMMSGEDVRLAYDAKLSYVIVSLAGREAIVRSFRVNGACREEALVVIARRGD